MDRTDFSDEALGGNVATLYAETAATHPDRLALARGGRLLTHGELRERGERFAGGLHDRGLDPGDRIALYLPNGLPFVVALLGGFAAGAPPVPMNPQLRPPEIADQLRDSDAEVLVAHRSFAATVAATLERLADPPQVVLVTDDAVGRGGDTADDDAVERGSDTVNVGDEFESLPSDPVPFEAIDGAPTVVDRADDDVALHPYTSGTTGEPKGVLYTHRNMRAQSLLGFDRTDIPSERERFLSPLPLAHIAGLLNRTWQPLVRGGSVYLMRPSRWDPEEAMALIEEASITKLGAIATMYVDIVEHERFGEYDLSSLEEAMQGGTKLPGPVARRFEEATGIRPFEAYGLTETGGGTHVGHGSTFGHRVGTIGQPLRASDCKVVDDDGEEVPTGEPGELLVRGPHVMAGYHERPAATDAAFTDHGYFRTGDVVRRDVDNYYEVLDRKGEVIDTAGYDVYPTEVEDVLYDHPTVVDAAVVGEPDDRRGERVVAYVVTGETGGTGEAGDATEAALRELVADRLAAYKHPREFRFVESLPRTSSGKVRKTDLAAD